MDTARPFISRSEFSALLGCPSAPCVLDVRPAARFAASTRLVATARYCAPDGVAHFAKAHAPCDLVVYCVYGHEKSQNAAQVLRNAGWNARTLAGGFEGGEPGVDASRDLAQWRSEPLPTIGKRPDLGVDGRLPSRWIASERPKIDEVACSWLIHRFIDPRAEFLYVATDQVLPTAARLDAVVFDCLDAPVSHQADDCSFDALLAAFDLQVPALHLLATIVRDADTGPLLLAPQAAGLLAISLDLSRLCPDDADMLKAAMPVYDALYAWCRDGQAQIHKRNPATLAGAGA